MAAPSAAIMPDDAGKAHLMAHMNKDHQTDLQHILQHFNGLSDQAAADPHMLDIGLDTMTVRTSSGTHVVKLDPPMASWADRRQCLIDMTMAARKGLGVPLSAAGDDSNASNHGAGHHHGAGAVAAAGLVCDYHPPRPVDWAVLAAVATALTGFGLVHTGQVEPGTGLWRVLETAGFPYSAQGLRLSVNVLVCVVATLHVAELWWFERTRLRAHGPRRGSRAWCLWMGDCLFGGWSTIFRFDALAAEAARGAEKKHA